MRVIVLSLGTLTTVVACASSGRPAVGSVDCTRRGDPVPFAQLFSDSAAAADVMRPLVAARVDTVVAWITLLDEPVVALDTLAAEDSVAREHLEDRLASIVSDAAPGRLFAAEAFAAGDGSMRFRSRSAGLCPPALVNLDELSAAIRREQQGIVADGRTVVRMMLDTDGRVMRAEVYESSGIAHLDDVALRVAYGARFTPAIREGVPSRAWAQLPFTFSPRP